jgi:hypothetical protein
MEGLVMNTKKSILFVVGLGILTLDSAIGHSSGLGETENSSKEQFVSAAHDVSVFVKDSLGISVPALAFLVEVDPNVVHLKDYLADSGKLEWVQELEKAELIDTKEVASSQGNFLRLRRSGLGREVFIALHARQ